MALRDRVQHSEHGNDGDRATGPDFPGSWRSVVIGAVIKTGEVQREPFANGIDRFLAQASQAP